jgi:hypothetical protein
MGGNAGRSARFLGRRRRAAGFEPRPLLRLDPPDDLESAPPPAGDDDDGLALGQTHAGGVVDGERVGHENGVRASARALLEQSSKPAGLPRAGALVGKKSADSRELDARTRPKARRAVSRVRQNGLASTGRTGIPSRRKARPISRAWRRPLASRLRCREQSLGSPVMSVAEASVAACRKRIT